jgi:hypothetical protein
MSMPRSNWRDDLRDLADRYPVGTRLNVRSIGHATVIPAADFRRETEAREDRERDPSEARRIFVQPAYGSHFEDRAALYAGGAGLFSDALRVAIRLDYVRTATRGVPESHITIRPDVQQPDSLPGTRTGRISCAAPAVPRTPRVAARNDAPDTLYELRDIKRRPCYTGGYGWEGSFRPLLTSSKGWAKHGLFPETDYSFYYDEALPSPADLADRAVEATSRARKAGYSDGQRDAHANAYAEGLRAGRREETQRIKRVLGL